MTIRIRPAGQEDYKEIYKLIEAAFKDEVYTDHDEHKLVERLRAAPDFLAGLSLVAELDIKANDRKIVGHILFTEIMVGDKKALALAPVSVLPDYQGRGIGGQLIKFGHQASLDLGYELVVLLGHADYYPKFGYEKASKYGILPPFDVPDENFMVKELKVGSLSTYKGLVVYPPAFQIDYTK